MHALKAYRSNKWLGPMLFWRRFLGNKKIFKPIKFELINMQSQKN
jgi:hypothetical protein